MLPLLYPAIVAGAVGVSLAGYLALKSKVAGKKVVLMGPSGAGKSTLQDRLTSDQLALTEMGAVQETFDLGVSKKSFKDLGIEVTFVDSSGRISRVKEALDAAADADLLIFVVDVRALQRPRYQSLARSQAVVVTNRYPEKRKMLVLSHADQALGDRPYQHEDLSAVPEHAEIAKLLGDEDPTLVNLLSEKSTEVVLRRVLGRLT
ncbi:50S ribosome-binding GTPase [Nocardioides sp. WL0053]|uniref:50S ribosome-binding GTPase n=1 Tax=Nocardioides jiangsuensis TaxID=2866161 RepID=A0ABS7RMH7_9ACTN|nr:GTPase [Nocardioides jiangsuensis]MBY9075956.1 50S ribosome-binding GTPase [Nocardioides jiangsuensis]